MDSLAKEQQVTPGSHVPSLCDILLPFFSLGALAKRARAHCLLVALALGLALDLALGLAQELVSMAKGQKCELWQTQTRCSNLSPIEHFHVIFS